MSEQDIKNHNGIGRTISKSTNKLDRVTPTILSFEGRLLNVENDLADNFLKKNASDEPTVTEVFDLGSNTRKWNNIYSVNFIGTSSAARYADLAEKYTFKETELIPGQVILISQNEDFECEISNEIASTRVLGILSENPAYKMNSEISGLYVALKGRVPCFVKGPIKKGECIVSYHDGMGIGVNSVIGEVSPGAILGKALNSIYSDDIQKIEVVV